MRNNNMLKRLAALLLCMAMVLSIPGLHLIAYADNEYSDELADLNSQYDELKKQQDAVQQQINKASNDKAAALAKKRNLNNQINLTQEQIKVLEEKIAVLSDSIAEKEAEIEALEAEIAENYAQYKNRLVALYRAGNPTALGVVLGAENFSDFLMQSEMLKRMAGHDQALLDGLAEDKADLEEKKAQLNSEKEEQDASKTEVESLKTQLNGQLSQTNTQIQSISALEAELQADKAAYQKKMAAIQAEIDDIYSQIQSSGDYVGGVLAWPVPGFRTITSEFGWRFGGSDYHTGFDISGSGVNGKSIVAANSGTVAYVKYGTSGYGRYLIVDHGGGYDNVRGLRVIRYPNYRRGRHHPQRRDRC